MYNFEVLINRFAMKYRLFHIFVGDFSKTKLKVSDCSLMVGDAHVHFKESELSKVKMTQEYIRKQPMGMAINKDLFCSPYLFFIFSRKYFLSLRVV